MSVVVVEPPAPIVSLEQAKVHLRAEDDDTAQNDYITSLVEVATGHIDGPDAWLGRAIGEQVLEATLCAREWARCRRVPVGPLRQIVSETPAADGRSIVVRYRAGDPANAVPAPIRHAILLMVGDLYANRESGGFGSVSFEVKMPTTVEQLLAPYRRMRV